MLPPDPARVHLRTIAQRFAAGFPEGPSPMRTVGREAEYPVVRADGSAAEISALWPHLSELAAGKNHPLRPKLEGALTVALVGSRYTFFSEVGRGTIEVLTGPCQDLWEIATAQEEAMEVLLAAIARMGWTLLGYGIQPLTAPTLDAMTPKLRYAALLDAIGDPWLWFTLTASDQVHASIRRHEVVPMTNLCNLMAPVTVALCANSPVYAGHPSGFCSAREGRMGEIHASHHRHGMPGRAVSDMDDLVRVLAGQPFLVELRRGDRGDWKHTPYGRPFTWWLGQHGDEGEGMGRQDPFDAFLLHEHYIWNSARPRSNHGTIELRAACQQPWVEPGLADDGGRRADHMAAAALGVAMVCAGPELQAWLEECLGPDPWPAMRAWHEQVVQGGLAAPEPAAGLLSGVLDRCEAGLAARGRGEERLLRPLRARLAEGKNPAQRALRTFQDEGIAGLVSSTAIR